MSSRRNPQTKIHIKVSQPQGNDGPGGFAAIINSRGLNKTMAMALSRTSIQDLYRAALKETLESLPSYSRVTIYSAWLGLEDLYLDFRLRIRLPRYTRVAFVHWPRGDFDDVAQTCSELVKDALRQSRREDGEVVVLKSIVHSTRPSDIMETTVETRISTATSTTSYK